MVKNKARQKEMLQLRVDGGWTLQMIGDKWGISRQRVQQIIGSTGDIATRKKKRRPQRIASWKIAEVVNGTKKTNEELMNITGISYYMLNKIKTGYGIRNKVGNGDSAAYRGSVGENKILKKLRNRGLPAVRKQYLDPYDIAVGSIRIDAKRATTTWEPPSSRRFSPVYRFTVGEGIKHREKADFYILLIDVPPKQDYFIIPSRDVPISYQAIVFAWPCFNERKWDEKIHWRGYHNRWDYIVDAYFD